jgi:hypothetical protein
MSSDMGLWMDVERGGWGEEVGTVSGVVVVVFEVGLVMGLFMRP